MLINFISTEVASYFAVLRDQVIRNWNVWTMPIDYLGSENNPFDVASFDIDVRSILIVSKLLTKDHHLVPSLKIDEVVKCDHIVKALALDKHRSTYFYRSREND